MCGYNSSENVILFYFDVVKCCTTHLHILCIAACEWVADLLEMIIYVELRILAVKT